MASVTNDNKNTSSPTNTAFSSSSKTWGEVNKTWGEYPSSWAKPQDLSTDTLNSASVKNDAKS